MCNGGKRRRVRVWRLSPGILPDRIFNLEMPSTSDEVRVTLWRSHTGLDRKSDLPSDS